MMIQEYGQIKGDKHMKQNKSINKEYQTSQQTISSNVSAGTLFTGQGDDKKACHCDEAPSKSDTSMAVKV